jgi:hypothetical protein
VSVSTAAEANVLLALRLAGVADLDAVARRSGEPADAVASVLEAALVQQMVRRGRGDDWALTPTGRARGEQLLHEVVGDDVAAVRTAYDAFLEVNPKLLGLCTDWQLRRVGDQLIPNDHTDPAHDEAVLTALGALHADAEPIVSDLAGVPTFASYAARFTNALARVLVGEVDYLLKPTVDSYHQVWFELHEHLLAALGLDRSAEAQRIAAEAGDEEQAV